MVQVDSKNRSPSGVKFMTYVVAYKSGEEPTPTSIGSRIMGGVCAAVALYDCAEGLSIAETALSRIAENAADAEDLSSAAQQELDALMSARDWRDHANLIDEEPGELLITSLS